MTEDKLFIAWVNTFEQKYLSAFESQLEAIVADKEHRINEDKYHIGNIVLLMESSEFGEITKAVLYKYGAEFISYIQARLISRKDD